MMYYIISVTKHDLALIFCKQLRISQRLKLKDNYYHKNNHRKSTSISEEDLSHTVYSLNSTTDMC